MYKYFLFPYAAIITVWDMYIAIAQRGWRWYFSWSLEEDHLNGDF